jgi:hypothetical protein
MQTRALALCAMAATAIACGTAGLFKQYEYEEEMFLSLDGSATVYVHSSIAALDALRGTSFDASSPRLDRDAVRKYFSAPGVHVAAISQSRRSGRRFVHVQLDVDDVRRLSSAPPFQWSTYRFDPPGARCPGRVAGEGDHFVYEQTVGKPAAADPAGTEGHGLAADPGRSGRATAWTGKESVAFRLHLPSRIDYHNTPTHEVGRGNILTWEQPLADRLRGVPLTLEACMQPQSILYRTLWLFGVTFMAVAFVFVAVIAWVLRKGKPVEARIG